MKKKGESKTGKIFKRVLDVRGWSDWDRTKTGTSWIVDTIKKLFVPQQHTVDESFDEAKQRLRLTESDIENKKKALLGLSILMAIFAVGLFIYALYLIINLHIAAFFLTIVIMGVALTLAFRYNFWYYQFKVRKLGCSISEWFHNGLMGGK